MKTLTIKEMENILGGGAAECKAVQALADTYDREDATPEQWVEWLDLFDKYCTD